MAVPESIKSFLDEHQVPYEIIHHRRDFTAQETAADTHTKGKEFAKTVVLQADGRPVMTVLPAIYQVSLDKARKALQAKEVQLASEDDIAQLCPDCEIGAMPPFGNLFKVPVYVDRRLAEDRLITFNAGTHEDVIRLLYEDFQRLTNPEVVDLAAE